MTINNETVYTVDLENKKIKVVREFDALVEKVWKAWTTPQILDEWWAPKPWKANTKSMDFREGGRWLYCMEGPDGSKHYSKADFTSITPKKSFAAKVAFCDEQGNTSPDFPNSSQWKNSFSPLASGTKVEVEISFSDVADLKKMVEMGFKEGFAAAHNNLDEIFAE